MAEELLQRVHRRERGGARPGDLFLEVVVLRHPYFHLEADDLVLHRPKGCSTCGGTGYRGRMALHEVMPIDEQLEKLTVRRSSADEITRAAREGGMSSLREDGWLKVRNGRTSIEEVLRVVG